MKSDTSMITGSPGRSLLFFALPMVLGNLFQQLYNIVDSIIVGQVCGNKALAAVNSTAAVVNVYISIALGLSVGCMIVFSQLMGAKKYARMKTAFYTAIISLAVLSIIMLLAGYFSTEWILKATNVPADTYADSKTYYQIYVMAFPALFIYNISNSGFNSLGKSRMTLFLLMGSSLLNVGLDLWFVAGLGMGVAGAAIATDISMYIAAVIALSFLIHHIRHNYPASEKYAIYEFRLLGNMLKVAVPTMMAQVVVSVGYVALQALVNTFGSEVMAGYGAAFRLDALCSVPMVQIGNAMATFAGQNVGAKQFDRVPQGIRSSTAMVTVIWLFFAALVWLFGRQLIGLFMNETATELAYTTGIAYMRVMCSFYILLGLMYIFAATLRGTGDAMISVVAVICNFGARCLFAYIMVGLTGSEVMIWWSNVIGWVIALLICVFRFRTGIWKTKRLADKV